MSVLHVDHLIKKYGRLTAVNGLNLEIQAGQVFGILGPNGSGKTTTLGMVLGVTQPTSGSFSWFGKGGGADVRKRIGAILERPVFYPYMDAEQNLRLSSLIREVDPKAIDQVLDMVGLLHRKKDAFKGYSLGMKQRLAIASAMLNNPDVLVLDEPTNGLDPEGIADVRKIIMDIASMGKTIIIASHLLYEVQKVCSHFCVLRNGNLIHQGPVSGFSDDRKFEIGFADAQKLMNALSELFPAGKLHQDGKLVELTAVPELTAGELNSMLFSKGISVDHLRMLEQSLEDQFLQILKEHDQAN